MKSVSSPTSRLITRRNFIAGCAAAAFIRLPLPKATAQTTTFDPFSFVYICDSHLSVREPDSGYKLLQESQLFLQETIKAVNLLKPDFVIFGGDQVELIGANESNWQLFVDLVQSLNSPWSFVLGEQDVSGKTPPDKMRTFGPDWKGQGLGNNTPYWSMNPVPGIHFIGLDSSLPNSNTGYISKEQIAWLKSDLAANQSSFTTIFCHHPLLPPSPYDGGPPWDEFTMANGADVREIIGVNKDVRLVVNGHLYLNKVQLEQNVYHVSCAGLAVYPCQYKLFKITPEAIMVQSFTVNFPALVKKAYKSLISSNLAYKYDQRDSEKIADLQEGSKEDQNAVLSLTKAAQPQPLAKQQTGKKEKKKKKDKRAPKEPKPKKGHPAKPPDIQAPQAEIE